MKNMFSYVHNHGKIFSLRKERIQFSLREISPCSTLLWRLTSFYDICLFLFLSFSAIQFCFSVILQNLTHHPACQIHPAPFWSHERTCTFRLRSPHPYQDTKLLCLSTFANVKRTYGREKDGSNARKKERGEGCSEHLKRLISCTTVVM